jgi:hypothetical protein
MHPHQILRPRSPSRSQSPASSYPSPRRSLRPSALALLAAVVVGGACLSEAEKPAMTAVTPDVPSNQPDGQLDGAFVPIARNPTGTAPRVVDLAKTTDTAKDGGIDQDFYLAISKKELGSRWFLSTYLAQSDFGVFAMPLGTAVVSFKVQNNKLFMFKVQKGAEVSDLIKPEFVMEAYPLVTGVKSFEAKANANDYVLFDPAAGMNRFAILGSDKSFGVDINLVFSQKFRKIKDGYTFEQVWAGKPSDPMEPPDPLSGTLSLALRRYAESDGFVPMVLPPGPEHFFATDPLLIKDEGETMRYVRRWNITQKGQPIVWAISPIAEQINKDPRFAAYDIVGALKTGIEAWNQVFGFRALEARVAKDGEDYGADDVNYFAFDSDKAADAAFGVSRYNPNTGEIRGASIYFPLAMFIDETPAKTSVVVPAMGGMPGTTVSLPPGALRTDGKEPVRRSVKWGYTQGEDFCDLSIRSFDQLMAEAASTPDKGMSNKDYVERYIAHVAMHEVGHTLGLRHNFKGSLRPPSSSVMDYLRTDDSVAFGSTPGSYDVAAIRQLYGLSDMAPADPFCTDPEENVDPDCRVFDKGATPLATHFAPFYANLAAKFLSGALPPEYVVFVDAMVPHVRKAKDPAQRLAAYQAAAEPLRLPVGALVKANIRDFLTVQFYQRLFIRPLPVRTSAPKEEVVARPPTDPVLTAAVADVKAFLIDAEGTRSMDVRRASADLLKAFQHATAATALKEAREAVAAKVPMLTGNAAFEAMDLVGRIDRYLGAYFN